MRLLSDRITDSIKAFIALRTVASLRLNHSLGKPRQDVFVFFRSRKKVCSAGLSLIP
jgi:hypothetical protein